MGEEWVGKYIGPILEKRVYGFRIHKHSEPKSLGIIIRCESEDKGDGKKLYCSCYFASKEEDSFPLKESELIKILRNSISEDASLEFPADTIIIERKEVIRS